MTSLYNQGLCPRCPNEKTCGKAAGLRASGGRMVECIGFEGGGERR